MKSQIRNIVEVLERHEWSGIDKYQAGFVCPECRAPQQTGEGHKEGCKMYSALVNAENLLEELENEI